MARVLIVDDDGAVRALLCDTLAAQGHVIHTAANGSEALALLRLTPHAVIVFIGGIMPVMNGFELLEAVLADGQLARRHVFIPMSANFGFLPWAKQRLGIPDLPLLLKPFSAERALAALQWAQERLRVVA